MVLKRVYDEQLAHASCLVGCAVTGEAIVCDPGRNVYRYIEPANGEDVRDLASIGLDVVQGWMWLEAISACERNTGPLSSVEQLEAKAMVEEGRRRRSVTWLSTESKTSAT